MTVKLSRRLFLGGTALTVGAAGAGTYSRYYETRNLELTLKQVAVSSRIKNRIRILHIADMHASPWVSLEHIEDAFDLGLSQNPDLICVTGDFISLGISLTEKYISLLAKLSSKAPTFATMGNHDGGKWAARFGEATSSEQVIKLVSAADIVVLHNRSVRLALGETEIQLVGLGDWWANEMNVEAGFLNTRNDDSFCVLLSHNPDTKKFVAEERWDIMLSGHTHGGQIVVPFFGFAPFAPVTDRRYVEGLKPWRDRLIHVTRGIGSVPPIRFNCRPEVSILDLIPQ